MARCWPLERCDKKSTRNGPVSDLLKRQRPDHTSVPFGIRGELLCRIVIDFNNGKKSIPDSNYSPQQSPIPVGGEG